MSLISIARHYGGEFAIDAFAVSVLLNVYISIHSFVGWLVGSFIDGDGIISFSLFYECITFKSSFSGHNLHFSLSDISIRHGVCPKLEIEFRRKFLNAENRKLSNKIIGKAEI